MRLAEQDRLAEAEEALARADERGHPAAATKLGVLLESRGDVARAEGGIPACRRAWRRRRGVRARDVVRSWRSWPKPRMRSPAPIGVDTRLPPTTSACCNSSSAVTSPAPLLHISAPTSVARPTERSSPRYSSPARTCWTKPRRHSRRADQRGHGVAAHNLGVLLEHRRDFGGAEAAYRRARSAASPRPRSVSRCCSLEGQAGGGRRRARPGRRARPSGGRWKGRRDAGRAWRHCRRRPHTTAQTSAVTPTGTFELAMLLVEEDLFDEAEERSLVPPIAVIPPLPTISG